MFIHVIQGQYFDVLAQPYGIYTKPFRGGCLVDGRRDNITVNIQIHVFNQAVLIKPSPSSRPHHAVPIMPFPHHQAVATTKQCPSPSSAHHQANLPSHLIKSPYQAILPSDRSKHTLGSYHGRLLRSLAMSA